MIWADKMWIKMMDFGAKYGCHQNPHRSFFFKEYQFPVCARCTGILFVKPLAWIINCKNQVPFEVALLMLMPMAVDGSVQYLFRIESSNTRRFLSGMLGGFGISTIRFLILRRVLSLVRGEC